MIKGTHLPPFFRRFDGADRPFKIIGVNPLRGIRVQSFQDLMKGSGSLFFSQFPEFFPAACVRLRAGKIHFTHNGMDIQSGSSRDDRNLAASRDLVDAGAGHFPVFRHGKRAVRLDFIHQVMHCPRPFLRSGLRAADVHVFIKLHGVG